MTIKGAPEESSSCFFTCNFNLFTPLKQSGIPNAP